MDGLVQTLWVWERGAPVILTFTAVLGSGYFLSYR